MLGDDLSWSPSRLRAYDGWHEALEIAAVHTTNPLDFAIVIAPAPQLIEYQQTLTA